MWLLLSGGQPVTVAMDDAPVRELAWIPEMNLLVTGSFDKTLRKRRTRIFSLQGENAGTPAEARVHGIRNLQHGPVQGDFYVPPANHLIKPMLLHVYPISKTTDTTRRWHLTRSLSVAVTIGLGTLCIFWFVCLPRVFR